MQNILQYFIPQCEYVVVEATLRETQENREIQMKENQLVQLYSFQSYQSNSNYQIASQLIVELVNHFRNQNIYRFLIELVQKLRTKSTIIQYTNGNAFYLKTHLGNQIASLEYVANRINNFPQLTYLRNIIFDYFKVTFQTPPFEVNQQLISLYQDQLVKDIYLTYFNKVYQIQLLNYGHYYNPNFNSFKFQFLDDEVYPNPTATANYSQYGYQYSQNAYYQQYQSQQSNMTDAQYQEYQTKQYQIPQQQQYMNYNNYNNQNTYFQNQNTYSNNPQQQITTQQNSQWPIHNYQSTPQQYKAPQTQNYNHQPPIPSHYQGIQPQFPGYQGQVDYQPQPQPLTQSPAYQSSPQPPYPNQITSFPPTQGYQYNLKNNTENKAPQEYSQPYSQSNPTTGSYYSKIPSNEPINQQILQQNNFNINQNYQQNLQQQQNVPCPYNIQLQKFDYNMVISQIPENITQVLEGDNQITTNINNQDIQRQPKQVNSIINDQTLDLRQAQSVYYPQSSNKGLLEQNNSLNQVKEIQQPQVSLPPPPPPTQPQGFQNQTESNKKNQISHQESFNNIEQNDETKYNDKSLFEELFLNQSVKTFKLIDIQGFPFILQNVEYQSERSIKGFKNQDLHALEILKGYLEGECAKNKIDRTAEMKNLVSF